MFSISRLLVVAVTAVSVVTADYATVLADLKVLDKDTRDLTVATNAYTSTTTSGALRIYNLVRQLYKDIDIATADTQNTFSVTAPQATEALNYLNGTLLVDTKATNTATKSKIAIFTQQNLRSQVRNTQTEIKIKVDKLADALIAKAPTPPLKTRGTTIKNNFDAVFDDTIRYFS